MNQTTYSDPAARLATLEGELENLDPTLPAYRRADLELAIEVARQNARRAS